MTQLMREKSYKVSRIIAHCDVSSEFERLCAGDEALVTRPLRVVKVVAALAVGLDLNFRISS